MRRIVGAITTTTTAASAVFATALGVGFTIDHPAAGAAPDTATYIATDIVGPAGSGAFGDQVLVLSNGNIVITDPLFDGPAGADIGAVYLYDGGTHQLISTLTGSTPGDQVGWSYQHGLIGATEVGDSNFVVPSKHWHNGAAADAGAVTWVDGGTGLNGTVSAANSIVGASALDSVGRAPITVLTNGNYVVPTELWDNVGAADAGAVTWGHGDGLTAGVVGPSNSLVGVSANDRVGDDIVRLANGNYVVSSPDWGTLNWGAVTWGDGNGGTVDIVTTGNSLVGSAQDDHVGSGGVVALTNGNYVVGSGSWDGAVANVGAVTWGNGLGGTTGQVTSGNSLVGTSQGDSVGFNAQAHIKALGNGNYVVGSPSWNSALFQDVGAATWGDGTAGTTVGQITSGNSIVGSFTDDSIGLFITPLTNGNFVTYSSHWGAGDVGAVTWGSGAGGTHGAVSDMNSLVGSTPHDEVSYWGGVVALTNGNYVVGTKYWQTAPGVHVGAVTWGNGATGKTVGAVTQNNSLVGVQNGDDIAEKIVPLTNGNYAVGSPAVDSAGGNVNVGAVTWGNGLGGTTGQVSIATSVTGTSDWDSLGVTLLALTNGNYVAASPSWDNTNAIDAGIVTWGRGDGPMTGVAAPATSLVGTHTKDLVGLILTALPNGNYVVGSPQWGDGNAPTVGALTWGDGTDGTRGVVGPGNSLVGSTADDQIGPELGSFERLTVLPDSRYVALSFSWDNAGTVDAGAATLGDANTIVGPITAGNSLVTGHDLAGNVPAMFTTDGSVAVPRPGSNRVTLLHKATPPAVDPPQDEPDQPAAPGSGVTDYIPLTPARLADTRPEHTTVDGLFAAGGMLEAGSTLHLAVAGRGGVATDAIAVALNVTVTEPSGSGFVTVYPCGSEQPTASNLNYVAGTTVPNAVISKVGADGSVCVYAQQALHLVVDVNGMFPIGTTFEPINPARLLDTREGFTTIDGEQQGAGAVGGASGGVTAIKVTNRAGVPVTAAAVALNVTVTEPEAAGYATVYPCSEPRPLASNLNYSPGLTIPNLVIAKVGTNGNVCIFSQSRAHFVVDLAGYFKAGTTYVAQNPARFLDTRPNLATVDGQSLGADVRPAGSVTAVQITGRNGIPAGATTVVVNVTVTDPAGDGYVTVYPCGIEPPLASNLNFVAGQTIPNTVLSKIASDGTICLYNSQPTQLIADVDGYFP